MAERVGRRIVEVIVVVFASLYAVATLLGMIDRSYQMPLSLHGIMGTIVSYLFWTGFLSRPSEKKPSEDQTWDKNRGDDSSHDGAI
jgi:hypothetical protein